MENFYPAADGREAIAVIYNKYYGLVVWDYNMPEIDGREHIDYIRNKSCQPAVPILMDGDMHKLAAVEQSGVSAICD